MSLNGLDDAKVKEAYDLAVAEPGGWFLLKYQSRDEVELLGRGSGGIVEIRNEVAQYEEVSPLFGFLKYRRRNVLIKYVPEDCSRLVQARVAVHFNAVLERFSPHDTEFSISTAKELRDTKLSAACSLHTASGSTSSSTSSLRRRRLMEIAEDAEEDERAKRQSMVAEERPAPNPSAATSSPAESDLLPSTSLYSMTSDSSTSPSNDLSRSPLLDDPRQSFQSLRPGLYTYSSIGSNGKPKIRLAPRPSLDAGGRPHTSSATSSYRPVSNLPAGIKVLSKVSKNGRERPRTQQSSEPPSMAPPAIPEFGLLTAPRPHTSGGRPTTSSGVSIKALSSANVNTPKIPLITPEKARLMKMMELRKKKQLSTPAPLEPPTPSSIGGDQDDSLKSPGAAPKEVHDTLAMLNDMAKEDDSGIAFDASSTLRTDESDATRSDSYPVSPGRSSKQAASTEASSISDSTDETVQEDPSAKALEHGEQLIDQVFDTELEFVSPKTLEQTGPFTEPAVEVTEGLPQLLPLTYEPVPKPLAVPAIYRESDPRDPALGTKTGEGETIIENPAAAGKPNSSVVDAEQSAPDSAISEGQTSSSFPLGTEPSAHEMELAEAGPGQDTSGAAAKLETSVPRRNWPEATHDDAKELQIPTSKFSVQVAEDGSSAISPKASHLEESQIQHTDDGRLQHSVETSGDSPIRSAFSAEARRSITEDENGQEAKNVKRRALIQPIQTNLNAPDKSVDENISSDDDLMEELQSAIVQEAKPISVSKSPLSPVSPSLQERQTNHRLSRVFSGPSGDTSADSQAALNAHTEARSVSASAAYLNRIKQQPSKPLAKKVNLGSSISQRIKALEKVSSLAPGATTPGPTAPAPGASTAFFAVRKASVQDKRSPSIAERANSLNRYTPSPPSTSGSSPETLKMRSRSGSIVKKGGSFNSAPASKQSRPESISVTARIVREPNQPSLMPSEIGQNPSEYAPLDLKQSPLVIDHQKAVVSSLQESLSERRLSNSSKTSLGSKTTTVTTERRSSFTVVRDMISQGRSSFSEHRRSTHIEPLASSSSIPSHSRPPSTHANGTSSSHRLSMSSRRSTSSRDNPLSPPPTAYSSSSTGDEKEKKSSRAGRLLRRMSSSITQNRKPISHARSPTVREESEDSPFIPSATSPPLQSSINIGDVNVQFPDSLLWKRRSMLLDAQGYLIASPALVGSARDKSNSGSTRKFHLSEFKAPTVPDVEMQELPNSVVLEFIEGGGLQLACEDRDGQARVLDFLQDAHRSWTAHN